MFVIFGSFSFTNRKWVKLNGGSGFGPFTLTHGCPKSPGKHFVHPLKLIALSEQVICQLIFGDPNPKIFDMFHAAYKLIVE